MKRKQNDLNLNLKDLLFMRVHLCNVLFFLLPFYCCPVILRFQSLSRSARGEIDRPPRFTSGEQTTMASKYSDLPKIPHSRERKGNRSRKVSEKFPPGPISREGPRGRFCVLPLPLSQESYLQILGNQTLIASGLFFSYYPPEGVL